MTGIKHLDRLPSAMEPLLPQARSAELAELSCEILRKAGELTATVPCLITRQRIVRLVQEMNSYYSNLIEGHKTLPRDIEKALQQDYSNDPAKRENQHLSRAHIETEAVMLQRLQAEPELALYSQDFLCWLHGEFYRRLPTEMQAGKDQTGKPFSINPGQLRAWEVMVGRHTPPHYGAVPKFLDRFGSFYTSKDLLPTHHLISLAAAHHRLAWIHPFADGNGRITRLFSHACLVRCKVDSHGLWSLSRGLARRRQDYYAHLSNADERRWNDLDGRGNLSDRYLAEFCRFFLQTMLDQILFMSSLLQLDSLGTRIERYLQFEALHIGSPRASLSRLLKAAIHESPIERGRVKEIVGLGETSARKIIRLALDEKLLDSSTPKGPLSIVFSAQTMEFYFPKLYQDISVAEEKTTTWP